jgi:SWI/SNF-related matrix-associated actin-dependent regulator 1 of chromatin subfamily A
MFENYTKVIEGMVEVDSLLATCEGIGSKLAKIMSIWAGADAAASTSAVGVNLVQVATSKDAAKSSTDPAVRKAFEGFLTEQPPSMSSKIKLKDYQMLGLNWLKLMYSRNTSCILADEMGKSFVI